VHADRHGRPRAAGGHALADAQSDEKNEAGEDEHREGFGLRTQGLSRRSLESTMAAPSGKAESLALRAARVLKTSDLRD
jgi:hypothetical protein